jgi:hypothetical protein
MSAIEKGRSMDPIPKSSAIELSQRPPWLADYLRDHFAGSIAAVDLAGRRRQAETEAASRELLAQFVAEVKEDQASLLALMRKLNAEPSMWRQIMTVGATWLRALQSSIGSADLQRLRDLEILLMGVRGKELLWDTLGRLGILDTSSQQRLQRRVTAQRSMLERLHSPNDET